MATGVSREGGDRGGNPPYPQAGRPASAWTQPADGVFRDR